MYEEYNTAINAKYAIVLGIVIGILVLLAVLFMLYQTYVVGRRKKHEVESHLAVALA